MQTETPQAAADRASAPAGNSESDRLARMVEAGRQALENGDLRQALEKFGAVVEAFPDRPEGHNNLGALYTSIGEYARAETCFDKVLTLLPDNANILHNRGVVRSRQQKFAEAAADFRAALERNPRDLDCRNNLGVTYFMQGRYEPAAREFAAALEIRPDYANALLNYCDLEITRGDLDHALHLCETYLSSWASLDVRCKQLEIQGLRCREALRQARRTAEMILVTDPANEGIKAELDRLDRAGEALGTTPIRDEAAAC